MGKRGGYNSTLTGACLMKCLHGGGFQCNPVLFQLSNATVADCCYSLLVGIALKGTMNHLYAYCDFYSTVGTIQYSHHMLLITIVVL